ncbi:MAG: hypothetical protein ACOYD4_11890 [Solirubrobacterales bacterium]
MLNESGGSRAVQNLNSQATLKDDGYRSIGVQPAQMCSGAYVGDRGALIKPNRLHMISGSAQHRATQGRIGGILRFGWSGWEQREVVGHPFAIDRSQSRRHPSSSPSQESANELKPVEGGAAS